MRRTIVLVLFAALAAIGLAPTASAGDNFVAPLSGAQEVPARDTPATGVAKFKLREDGTVLLFKVNVENIDQRRRRAHSLRRRRGQRPGRCHPVHGDASRRRL